MNLYGGNLDGAGTLTISATATLNLAPAYVNIAGWTINNAGTTNWTAGDLLTEDTIFNNQAVFNAEEWAGDWTATGGSFENQGTFNSSGGHTLAIEFASSMAVNVLSGTLVLAQGGELSNAVEIAQDAALSLTGGTFVFPSLTVQGDGLMLQWGAYTVVQGTVNAQNYELRTGTLDGPGTLAIAQTFAWTGGTMTGTGTTRVNPGALGEIGGPAAKVLDRRSLEVANNAAVDYIGGTLTMSNTANLANSGTFQILGDLNILDGGGSPAATITNNGTFTKAQTEGGESRIEVTFNNVNGTIRVDAGILRFTYLQSINAAATLIIATNTQCQVGYLNFFDGAVQGAGTLSTLPGATINWFKGSATGTGKISVSGSGSIMHIAGPLALSGFSLDNFSTVSWDAGDITTAVGTIISNQPGATFAALSDNAMTGAGTFNNSGTFSKLLGAVATGQTRIGVAFNNKAAGGSAAEVHAIQGAISFQGAGTHDSLFNAPVGGAIEFLGPNSVQIALEGSRFSGMGGIYLTTFATINVTGNIPSSGRFLFRSRLPAIQEFGGTLTGSGTFVNEMNAQVVWRVGGLASLQEFQNNGAVDFVDGGVKSLSNSHLTNNNTITWVAGAGNIAMSGGAQIHNRNTFDIQSTGTIVNSDGYATVGLLNQGLFRKAAGGLTTVEVLYEQVDGFFQLGGLNVTFTRNFRQTGGVVQMGNLTDGGGTLTVNGKYDLSGQFTWLSIDEGTLTVGDGLLVADATVSNASGTINGDVANAGRFIIGKGSRISSLYVYGDFTQLPGGILDFEISTAGGAPTYDYLFVNAIFTAGGTLTVSSMAPFNPAIGQQFILIAFWERGEDPEGQPSNFATMTLPTLPAPRQWKQQKWFDNDFTLEVE